MSRHATAKTIAKPFTLKGYGLHKNQPCSVRVVPAEGGGLRFVHTPSKVVIPAEVDYVGDISLATTLTKDGVVLQTVEHILSALYGHGVDHALIEVDGDELPILDGSAEPWANAIINAGLRSLQTSKSHIKILRPIEARHGEKWIRISPHSRLQLNYTINFANSSIGRQSMKLAVTPNKYQQELAPARTFCQKSEIEYMHSRGLALGGNLDNAVVYDGNGCLNDNLRFENEAVRHKMLDLIGDLALLGTHIVGHIEAYAAGHALHVALVKQLLSEPDAWVEVESIPTQPSTFFRPNYSQELATV
ncbi:MAG: UDP-3-O-acyl-N-acetylglucosamine deacetylase [Holophagaceae bacterium]|nr:UDP-3-O-acyl-N-acetylglucosamine deacetylase [Holophagaceae bacterium]